MDTGGLIQVFIYIVIAIWIVLVIAGCILWRDWIKRLIALGVLGIVVFQFIIFPVFLFVADTQGEPHLSPYFEGHQNVNQFYKDVGEYEFPGDFKGIKTRCIVSSATILNSPLVDPEDSIYICIGVERRYDPAEVEAVMEFCAAGGRAIIADDHGFINDISHQVGVLSLEGQFLDENFDKNQNFTVVKAFLGVDRMENGLVADFENRVTTKPDGHWDDDNDRDGKIDEDPINNMDDDEDNGRFESDLKDNDRDGMTDEEREGVDEDPKDDDGDGEDNDGNPNTPARADGKDNNGDGVVDEGFNEEFLDGKNNDPERDTYIDEDLFQYTLILNDATGFISEGTRVISYGSERSFVDMDGDGKISIPDEDLLKKGRLADEISSPGHEIQIIVEVPISPEGTQIDVRNGDWVYPDGTRERPPGGFDISEAGSIVFISDPGLFIDDEYTLDHITFDVRKPFKPTGNANDDDLDGLFDEDREIASETGIADNPAEVKDKNLIKDNTGGDYIILGNMTDMKIAKQLYPASMLDREKGGNIIIQAYDYDNAMFLEHLIYYLLPEGGTLIYDESRHEQPSPLLVPIYKSLSRLTWLTSSTWLSVSITASAAIILAFAVMIIKEKENWIHRFNITQLSSRENLPITNQMQTEAIRKAMFEKARLTRGLSPEEFKDLEKTTIMASIKDPELRELISNETAVYDSKRLSSMAEKIRRFGK